MGNCCTLSKTKVVTALPKHSVELAPEDLHDVLASAGVAPSHIPPLLRGGSADPLWTAVSSAECPFPGTLPMFLEGGQAWEGVCKDLRPEGLQGFSWAVY